MSKPSPTSSAAEHRLPLGHMGAKGHGASFDQVSGPLLRTRSQRHPRSYARPSPRRGPCRVPLRQACPARRRSRIRGGSPRGWRPSDDSAPCISLSREVGGIAGLTERRVSLSAWDIGASAVLALLSEGALGADGRGPPSGPLSRRARRRRGEPAATSAPAPKRHCPVPKRASHRSCGDGRIRSERGV